MQYACMARATPTRRMSDRSERHVSSMFFLPGNPLLEEKRVRQIGQRKGKPTEAPKKRTIRWDRRLGRAFHHFFFGPSCIHTGT
jgi:hypothetical protein